jgi:aryl-alcohol dehydrogenase-like predicted oxidoreductase
MDYVMLGNSGLTVSRLALGAMTFTNGNRSMASINKVDRQLADSMIGCARDAGVNFFDTADIYDRGDSEVVLGKALKGSRNDVVIATKVGMRTGRPLTQAGLSRRHGWSAFTHGQMRYSLLGRDIERDFVPMARQYGLGLTVWSPLAFGFLSGKLTRETLKSDGKETK